MDKLVYWEIPTTDVESSKTFFAELFGWDMQKSTDDYYMFAVEDGMGGGLQQVEDRPGHGISVYVGVDDIPATLEKAEGLGAKIVHAKTEIGGGHGYWADFEAPGGSRIGLWSKA